MEVVRDLAVHVDNGFTKVDKRFDKLEVRVGRIEALMVTKDYLDDKLVDRRGDMVGLVRREYDKTERLVGILEEDCVISPRRATELRTFEVFPRPPQV